MFINPNGQTLEEYYRNDLDSLEELVRMVEGDPSVPNKERCYPGTYELIQYERWATDSGPEWYPEDDEDLFFEDDIAPEDIIRIEREA